MAGRQPATTYIGRRQRSVDQWADLRPIFKVCARKRVYKREGGAQEGRMVVSEVGRDVYKVNLGGYLAGYQEELEGRVRHTVGYWSGDIGVRKVNIGHCAEDRYAGAETGDT